MEAYDYNLKEKRMAFKLFYQYSNQNKAIVEKVADSVRKNFGKQRSKLFLFDMGAGEGSVTVPLAEELFESFKEVTLLALDIHKAQLADLKRLAARRKVEVKAIVANALALPIKPTFKLDFVLFAQSLSDMPSREKIISGAYSLLRKGGLMCIILSNPNSEMLRFKKKFREKVGSKSPITSDIVASILSDLNLRFKKEGIKSKLLLPSKGPALIHLLQFLLRKDWAAIKPEIKKEVMRALEAKRKNNSFVLEHIDDVFLIKK